MRRRGFRRLKREQAGVNKVAADIEAQGGRITGKEITVESGGVRIRPDLGVQWPDGGIEGIEVKTGHHSRGIRRGENGDAAR